jgi:opacity protein-like surface antigen
MIKYYCNIKFNVLKILKIKIFIILLTLFFSANSNARTVGNYIGVDLIKTNLSFSTEEFMHPDIKNVRPIEKSIQTNSDSSYSFGLKYGYALNYRGFFIAPGLIYEKNNVKNYLNRSSESARSHYDFFGKSYSKINKRYGAKIDVGVDINESFSIYGTIGRAINYYQSYGSLYFDIYTKLGDGWYEPNLKDPWKHVRGKKSAPFFGGGFRIKIYKNWLVNGEYNYTRFTIDTKNEDQTGNLEYGSGAPVDPKSTQYFREAIKKYYNNNVGVFKLGLNFNF